MMCHGPSPNAGLYGVGQLYEKTVTRLRVTATLTATGIAPGGTPWPRWTTDLDADLRDAPQSDPMDAGPAHF